jgi:hypothetical protein
VIETETVRCFPTLACKVKLPSLIGFRGAEHRLTILGAISYGHIGDWIAIRVKHNTFDLPSNLWRVDDSEFSHCHGSWDEERKQKRDSQDTMHSSIIDSGSFQSKDSCREQAITLKFRVLSIPAHGLSPSHMRENLFVRSLKSRGSIEPNTVAIENQITRTCDRSGAV